MADLDLDKLSLADLKTLEKDVRKAISSFEQRRKRELRGAAKALAAENGFTLADLFDTSRKAKARAAAPPRYRHPDDPSRSWSGRGRMPLWLKEAEATGHDREEFAIG